MNISLFRTKLASVTIENKLCSDLLCKTRALFNESGDGIRNGGFSAADDEISHGGMEKCLFQSPDKNLILVSPRGIEPRPSEPESEILSIKLRRQFSPFGLPDKDIAKFSQIEYLCWTK